MATLEQGRRWLDNIAYMPGWRLKLEEAAPYEEWTAARLVVDFVAPNSYPPHDLIPLRQTQPLHLRYVDTEEQFRRMLLELLDRVHEHETREWFKDRSTGKPIFDPHEADR